MMRTLLLLTALVAGCATVPATDSSVLDSAKSRSHGLQAMLANSASRRIFVVLHLAGSHGPTYYKRVPAAYARFQPACRSVDVSACSQAELVNAYDNTILYTDHVLAETIKVLQAVPGSDSTMIYMSDHGEALGERGFYLHGAPNSIAPDVQRVVPFLIWMSPGFSASRQVTAAGMYTYRCEDRFGSMAGSDCVEGRRKLALARIWRV